MRNILHIRHIQSWAMASLKSLSDRCKVFALRLVHQYPRRLGSSGEAVPRTRGCLMILNQLNLRRNLPVVRVSPNTQWSFSFGFNLPQYRWFSQYLGLVGCMRHTYRTCRRNIQLSNLQNTLDDTTVRK